MKNIISLKRQYRHFELQSRFEPNEKKRFELQKKMQFFAKEIQNFKKKKPIESKKTETSQKIDKTIIMVEYKKTNSESKIKGLSMDYQIMEYNFQKIGYSCKTISILKHSLIPTTKHEYFFFSEILPFRYCVSLLQNKKTILFMPNIDSYPYDSEIKLKLDLQKLQSLGNFYILCKTRQIYQWMQTLLLQNIFYIHFVNNLTSIKMEIPRSDPFHSIDKKSRILLDSGSSTTGRKYLKEVVQIFVQNPNLPYHLFVKTTPLVFQQFLHPHVGEKKFKNITFIKDILSIKDLSTLYDQMTFFIYLSKFDGYGLALSKAIHHSLFIFCLDGKPWNELLEHYPRKCLIQCHQDFKNKRGKRLGFALSQIYYKANFQDFYQKLVAKAKYDTMIENTENETNLFYKNSNEKFQQTLTLFLKKIT